MKKRTRKPDDPRQAAQAAQQQATASREKVREMVHRTRPARQSQRPVEKNARRRPGA
jgi:hypothetical protein